MRIFIVLAMFTLAACGGGSGTPGGGMNDGSSGAGSNGGMTGGETDDGTGSGSDGGGTDGGGNQASLLEKWRLFETGSPTLDMTSAEISAALTSVTYRSTHTVLRGLTTPLNIPAGIDYGILRASAVMNYNGVPVAEVRTRITGPNHRDEDIGYHGWLDHTSFAISVGCDAEVGLYDQMCSGSDFFDYFSYSALGDHSGTTPTGIGSATWRGVMVGMEESPDKDAKHLGALNRDVFFGSAKIKIDDLAAPDADVSFTGIHNVTDGTPRSDISWDNLPITDGVFGTVSEGGDHITGMFNGPGNPEVGGHFIWDGIVGAFGAKR